MACVEEHTLLDFLVYRTVKYCALSSAALPAAGLAAGLLAPTRCVRFALEARGCVLLAAAAAPAIFGGTNRRLTDADASLMPAAGWLFSASWYLPSS